MRKINFLLLFFSSFFLTSCYYHVPSSCDSSSVLVYIPEIDNDDLGSIRTAIIHSLAQYNILTSLNNMTSTHQLHISLVDYNSENIGFAYTPTKNPIPRKDIFLISNEGRLSIKAKVLLVKKDSKKPILNTFCLVDTSFDFEPDLARTSTHNFSLGQMGMYDEGKNIAEAVLYEKLGSIIGRVVSYEIY